jgi:hypothetical protein
MLRNTLTKKSNGAFARNSSSPATKYHSMLHDDDNNIIIILIPYVGSRAFVLGVAIDPRLNFIHHADDRNFICTHLGAATTGCSIVYFFAFFYTLLLL